MAQANRQRIKEVFFSALQRPAGERRAYLDDVCSDDQEIRQDVEVLLESYDSGFLENEIWPESISDAREPSPVLAIGTKFSHYEIIELIGRGGMGEVYLAHDSALDRRVAIKVLHERSGFGRNSDKRLLREARLAAQMDHRNICAVYEVGETFDRPYIAMQYLEGETLDSKLSQGPLTIEESVRITRHIASALSEAHSRGLIHRDIKPSNVILDHRGQLKVLDFGLAKRISAIPDFPDSELSDVGVIAGTVGYMSPEQIRGQPLDERTDVWGLGVVLYQSLSGRLPFRGETKADTAAAILFTDPERLSNIRPDLPPAVDSVVAKALARDLGERYASVDDFDRDLSLLQDGAPRPKRRWLAYTSAAGGSLALVLAVWGFSNFALPASRRQNAFSSANAGNLRISNIYSAKRGPNGSVGHLQFSPDGRLLSFTVSVDRNSAIYVKPVGDGEPLRITDGKTGDQTPVWSQDGQRLAFISDRGGQTSLWSVSYLGGAPTLLANLEGERSKYQLKKWSNDGKRIFFSSGSAFKTLDIDSGQISEIELRGVTGQVEGDYGISSDEGRLAFVSIEKEKERLWVQSLVSGTAQRISEGDFHNWTPVWFPDGQSLAYSSDQNGNFQIYVRDLNSAESRQVTFGDFNASEPVVAPDGQKIAYVSNIDEANVFSLDLGTKHEEMLTSNVNMQLFAKVSPDAKHIAFQTTDDGAKLYNSPMKIQSLDDSNNVLPLQVRGSCPEWLPSGDAIVYARLSGTDQNLWALDVSRQRERRLTSVAIATVGNATAPYEIMSRLFDVAPDGSKVAFISRDGGGRNVWTVAADGSDERKITSYEKGAASASAATWSPDSGRIAFVESRGSDLVALAKENQVAVLDSGNVRYVSEVWPTMRLLGWSSDGAGVYFAVQQPGFVELRYSPIDGRIQSRQVAKMAAARFNGISLSADRTAAAFSARIDGVENVFLLNLSGGNVRKLTANEDATIFYSGLSWTPDSKKLIYSKQTGGAQVSLISNPN